MIFKLIIKTKLKGVKFLRFWPKHVDYPVFTRINTAPRLVAALE